MSPESDSQMMKAFFWDECGCEVDSIEIEIPPGLTERQMLILFDDAITSLADQDGTYDRKVRHTGEVFVLDALYGHDKVTRVYWSQNPDAAKKLAEEELLELINSD